MIRIIVAPKRPRPTVNIPATPPARNAMRMARRRPDSRAAFAVRTFARTASHMPVNPVSAEKPAPRMNASERPNRIEKLEWTACAGVGSTMNRTTVRMRQEDAQRRELALEVGARALLDRLRDLLHLVGALRRGEHLADQVVREDERHQRHEQDHPERVGLERAERGLDGPTFSGGQDVHGTSSVDVRSGRVSAPAEPGPPQYRKNLHTLTCSYTRSAANRATVREGDGARPNRRPG